MDPGVLPAPGYVEIGAIAITPRRAVLVQAFSLLLALATLVVLLWAGGITSVTIGPAQLVQILGVFAGASCVIFLHEAVHGLVFALSGLPPRFSAGIVHGMPVLATTTDRPYRRNTALICLLAPLVLIDVALLGLSVVQPTLYTWIIAPVVINTAGAAGDLWQAAHLAGYGPAVLVADVPDGLVVHEISDEKSPGGRPPHPTRK